MAAKAKPPVRRRFEDPGTPLWLHRPIWVHCPRCGNPALVDGQWKARIACVACHHVDATAYGSARSGAGQPQIAYAKPRCFRCGGMLPKRIAAKPRFHKGKATGRAKCPSCGHIHDYPVALAAEPLSAGIDPFFGYPVYLSVPVGRWTLWAWNLRHLEWLEAWISASLRERRPPSYHFTMMARLPQWMKRASNRQAVLKGLARLRAKAAKTGIA